MPTYDYNCKICPSKVSHVRGISEQEPTMDCPNCKVPMVRVFGFGAVTFSGDGFYSNDKKTQISMPGLQ